MGIERLFLIISTVLAISYYIHEYAFCRAMGIPLALVNFDIARATIISIAALIIPLFVYVICNVPCSIFVMWIYSSKKEDRADLSLQIFRIFPLLLLSGYTLWHGDSMLEYLDKIWQFPILKSIFYFYTMFIFTILGFVALWTICFAVLRTLLIFKKINKYKYYRALLTTQPKVNSKFVPTIFLLSIIPLYLANIVSFATNNGKILLKENRIVLKNGLRLKVIRLYGDVIVYQEEKTLKIFFDHGGGNLVEVASEAPTSSTSKK